MRALRILGLVWGLTAALAVLTSRRALRRYVARLHLEAATPPARDLTPTAGPPVGGARASRGVTRVRVVVGGLGLLVLLTGVWKALHVVQPGSYVWLAIWLAGAVVVHDGVLVPVLSVLRAGAHSRFFPLPERALVLLKGGFLVGGLLVLVVVPEIWAQHLGPLNPTVLPGDYASRLVTTLGVIALLTALAVAAVLLRRRAGQERSTRGQVERRPER